MRCVRLLSASTRVAAAARCFSTPGKVTVNITTQDGTSFPFEAPSTPGQSVMTAIRDVAALDMLGMCEGKLECATCHARLSKEWAAKVEPPTPREQDLLDQLDDFEPTSRLCCQIPLNDATNGIEVSMEERKKN